MRPNRYAAKPIWLKRALNGLAACVLLLQGGAAGSAGPVPPRLFTAFTADFDDLEQMGRRYDVVIWHNHPRLREAIAALKSSNPDTRVLMYRQLFCVLEEETPMAESVGSYAWISENHPEWFQLAADGTRVEVPDYPGRWVMDLHNPEWQAFWIEKTLTEVRMGGWDGVFVDDALTTVQAHDLPPMSSYPDDAALQDVVAGFLGRIHAAFREEGKLVVANASTTYYFPGLWERWLDLTDGLMEEHFAGRGWTWADTVGERQIQAMRAARDRGKWMLCFTYGALEDRETMETSLAAYLLGAGPGIAWSYRPHDDKEKSPWDPSWEADLGLPLAEALRDADGVWRREFERGSVVVNTTPQPRHVQLSETELTLEPRQGKIIRSHSE